MSQAKVPVLTLRRGGESQSASSLAATPRSVVPVTPAVDTIDPLRKAIVANRAAMQPRAVRSALPVRAKLNHPSDLLSLLNEPLDATGAEWTRDAGLPALQPSSDAAGIDEALCRLPLFAGVDAALRSSLCSRGRVLLFPEGEELLREGERVIALVCLLRGSAKMYFTSSTGLQGVAQIVAAPTSVGTNEIVMDQPAQCSLRLLERSEVLVLPAESVRAAMKTSPRLMENLLEETNVRLRQTAELARSLLFESAEKRLARLLLRYLELYGLPTHGGTMIRLSVTQNDFAEALGLNRRSITRALTAWAKEGIVDKPSGQYVVSDLARLQAIAEG